jgi:malonate transporter
MIQAMWLTLKVVIPVFGLVLAGMAGGRTNVIGTHASDSLNRFVVWFALPALLFETVAKSRWVDLWQPDFIAVYGISALSVLCMAMIAARWRGQALADVAIEGLNACYANVGFVGFPIAMVLLGPEALLPTTIAAVMGMCVFFALAIVFIEISLHANASMVTVGFRVFTAIGKHPLIVAPLCGVPFTYFGVVLPVPVIQFLDLLAAAAPCALVAIGIFIVQQRTQLAVMGQSTVTLIVLLKLVMHPLLAWLLAVYVFDLTEVMMHAVVLMAALPTGTGSFMLAEYYGRDARVSSRVTVLSTLLSVVTIALVMVFIRY